MRQFFMTFAKVIALYPFDEARLDFGPKGICQSGDYK